jgi:hypothetical protein
MNLLDANRLRKLFNYNPQTGTFTRLFATKGKGGAKPIGSTAGFAAPDGRFYVDIEGRRYAAHRLAWLYMTGEWPTEVDHKNRDPLDNRWANLRLATRSQNNANTGLKRHNTSGLKGVSFDRQRGLWKAQICVDKKRMTLGRFPTAEQAADAYAQAARAHFGEFAAV